MANTIITPTLVMNEVGERFVNNLGFAKNVTRKYEDAYRNKIGKVGYTVHARLPQRFTVAKGQALQLQPLQNRTVPITLTDQAQVAFGWSTADRTMLIDEVRENYVNPAADALANQVDLDGITRCTKDIYNSEGLPGTIPTTNITFLRAGVKLTNTGVTGTRKIVVDPLSMATIVNANYALFSNSKLIEGSLKSGRWNNVLNIQEWIEDQNVYRHTYGTYGGSPVVNGAGQTGSSLITSGWSSGASTLNKGDVFTIAGVYAVNPQSYTSMGILQDFVVKSTVSDTAGAMTISIDPPIITSGQLQTVDSSPANSAVITVRGATGVVSPQSLEFTKDAFALVIADLYEPKGASVTFVRSKQFNISIRMITDYEIGTDQEPTRLDILYGWATVRPEAAVRVQG